jgi:hypothetical protein
MIDRMQKPQRPGRHVARVVELRGTEPDDDLTQYFIEERFRRSLGITGYLISGGGAGAITCWFAINSLYAARASTPILRLLLAASGFFLAAVVLGFFAALAGYKVFDTAAALPAEAFNRPYNRADRWLAIMTGARIVAATLIAVGGAMAFSAYLQLCRR